MPWSTWPITVTTGGRGRSPSSALLLVVLEVLGLKLGLLLLAGVDQAHLGADLGGEELDHVVGERLGRGDHLALQEQEADDVAGRAVELRAELLRRRAALDDDLGVGHRRVRRRVGRELRRLELLEVATAPARPALRGGRGRRGRRDRHRAGGDRRRRDAPP